MEDLSVSPVDEPTLLPPEEQVSGPLPPTLPAQHAGQQYSAEWLRIFAAMDALRLTLESRNLLACHPAVAHDFVVLLGALEAARGDALAEAYWSAHLDRIVARHPKTKAPPPPESPGGGSM